jgi:hypothetical protein
MRMTGAEREQEQKQRPAGLDVILEFLLIPVLFVGACLAIPYSFALLWVRQLRERRFRSLMKSRGRLIAWPEFLRLMRNAGGTCIEERFSPKGPVRFWWTPENIYRESPHEIIDWFTMRKGRQHEPFVHWCRARYTSADGGSAVLVDASLAPKREIYTLWSECRSDAARARWIEVAPPEILPRRPER